MRMDEREGEVERNMVVERPHWDAHRCSAAHVLGQKEEEARRRARVACHRGHDSDGKVNYVMGGLKTRIGDGLITLHDTFAIVRGDIKKRHMISYPQL